jgi:hypothetical protein
VNQDLPNCHRIGKILRQDYWFDFPEEKEAYLAKIDAGEMTLFENLINQQSEKHPSYRLSAMTSGLFLMHAGLAMRPITLRVLRICPQKHCIKSGSFNMLVDKK